MAVEAMEVMASSPLAEVASVAMAVAAMACSKAMVAMAAAMVNSHMACPWVCSNLRHPAITVVVRTRACTLEDTTSQAIRTCTRHKAGARANGGRGYAAERRLCSCECAAMWFSHRAFCNPQSAAERDNEGNTTIYTYSLISQFVLSLCAAPLC